MLSWVRWALRYPLVRRLLLAAVGMLVRRRLDALRMSLFTDAGGDADGDADDGADDDASSRRWPLVALLIGAVVGWVAYRATRREERQEFEWTPADDPATWTPATSTAVTDDGAVEPTATGRDDGAEATAAEADATGPAPDLDQGAAVLGQPLSTDDLKVIEGIGPKIEQVLNDSGIATWGDLSSADVDRLREILDAAGPRYRMHDPGEWPYQAALLERGEWERFAALGARGSEADGT